MPKDTPKPESALARQLLWYGAAAGAATLLAAPEADAQIVFTDVNPDVTLSADPGEDDATFNVDFDGDGDPELFIFEEAQQLNGTASNYVAGFTETAQPDQMNAVAGVDVGGYQYFDPLSAGQSISAGNVSTIAVPPYGPTFTFQGGDPAGWVGAGDKYAGVQFLLDGGATHYGWVLLEIPANGTVTVKAFAYESTAGEPILAGATPTAIEPGPDGTPGTHALSSATPNPFRGGTALTLEVAETQHVTVAVYDALGQHVATLHDGALAAGSAHRLTLAAADLAAGVYVVRVTGETFSDARAVTLAR
jgi:hypothetical protein